ncbi:dihydrodipicolinate synthase family protein [Paractinoplanes lichenicola]|uniref:Dihydrodipicolinate synthase family protein n=1 Tax=Paractinoplanes lichenicola TaxID=2802976 RepID=A0ABS1VTI9_9ACTN|nr:dihydrodipicolinate synthase family protein [Actinoplanes lichenicola]MBL7257789.1 dihydrodipicolinate synthase family protein [Actinoplanes lichenicola]
MTLSGLYVPLITPFAPGGSVDLAALEQLAHDVLDAGATGLVALGTTGEPSSLTETERSSVLDVLTKVSASLIVGGPTVPDSATAALTLVPPFVRPGEDGVVAYLTSVAARSPVPLIVYHVPYRTAQPLSVDALHRIAAIDGVAGIKLATGSIDADVIALMAAPPPHFAILGGDDVVISPLLALGAHGAILASAHIETQSYATLVGSWEPTLGHRLSRLSAALFAEPNPAVIKAVLHAQCRIPTPDVRLPLLPASKESLVVALETVSA